jgi:hypothetical protein
MWQKRFLLNDKKTTTEIATNVYFCSTTYSSIQFKLLIKIAVTSKEYSKATHKKKHVPTNFILPQ